MPNERAAIGRLLWRSQIRFNLVSTGVYIGSHLVAFQVCELLTDGYAITHFLKFDRTFYGVAAFADRSCSA